MSTQLIKLLSCLAKPQPALLITASSHLSEPEVLCNPEHGRASCDHPYRGNATGTASYGSSDPIQNDRRYLLAVAPVIGIVSLAVLSAFLRFP